MNKKISNFFENFFINFIITLMISGLPGIYSIIMSIYTKKPIIITLYEIPGQIYIFFALPLIIYLIYSVINQYIKKRMKEGITYTIKLHNQSPWGSEKIGTIVVNGLLWVILQDNYDALRYDSKTFEIDSEPRCPKCEMKLYYKKCKWWYQWDCINETCNYKLRTWNHQDKIEDIVRKKVEYELEKNNYNNSY